MVQFTRGPYDLYPEVAISLVTASLDHNFPKKCKGKKMQLVKQPLYDVVHMQ